MKKIMMILLLTLVGTTAFAQQNSDFSVIEPEKFKQEINKENIQLIDVRTPEEFKEGHIGGAKNIDFRGEDFLAQFSELDKNQAVYIYCRSGNRSAKASEKLFEAGFTEIIDLKGGYKAWNITQKK